MSWGNNQISPLPNMKKFTIDVPLNQNQYILRINGNFDITKGIFKWHFMTLDTLTMDLPEDPDDGFFPPNVNSPEGEGSVHFVINLKNGLLHNTLIQNQAENNF